MCRQKVINVYTLPDKEKALTIGVNACLYQPPLYFFAEHAQRGWDTDERRHGGRKQMMICA